MLMRRFCVSVGYSGVEMDLRQMNKEFLMEFIELYRSHPCLWQIKSSEYSDRVKKNKAYEEMVVKLQEVEPSATKKTVVKKLDSMRGCFRKEAKKVKASKTTGTGADDVYVPHLWYYEHLLFLSDQEIARDSISNMTESTEKMQRSTSRQSQVDSDIDADSSHDSTPADTAIEEVGDHTRPLPRTSFARRGAVPVTIPNTKKVKKTKHDDIMKQLEVELNKPEDDDDIIGRNIANKLRRLPAEIKIVTEKLIMDVLYEAFLGNINKFTRITFNNHNAAVLENRSSGSSSLGTYGTHFPPVVPQDSSDWPVMTSDTDSRTYYVNFGSRVHNNEY